MAKSTNDGLDTFYCLLSLHPERCLLEYDIQCILWTFQCPPLYPKVITRAGLLSLRILSIYFGCQLSQCIAIHLGVQKYLFVEKLSEARFNTTSVLSINSPWKVGSHCACHWISTIKAVHVFTYARKHMAQSYK